MWLYSIKGYEIIFEDIGTYALVINNHSSREEFDSIMKY